ncbi:MAG: hypothetical protein GXX91_05665 [Verrucomicrobiaceae bacterium]|nr:hypothetical protein [Verrucomicrobiaceae bacterium]
MTPTLSPPPSAESLAVRMNDFPSGFSPVLVKELRQGMRTHLFVGAFLLLQVVMIFSLFLGVSSRHGPDAANGFFWFFIVAMLLVVQPLRGFNSLSDEYLRNTMDLIQLTRLDSWRITLGKWTALNAQSLLFLTGVLPYLVMRYFLGNVNFVVDLVALGMVGLGSALASAITVGCSAFRFTILRGLFVLGFAFGFSGLFGFLQSTLFASGLSGSGTLWQLGLIALSLVYGCFFFLSFGASRIASLSENLATRKRVVALGFALLVLSLGLAGIEEEWVIVVSAIVLGLAAIDALTEPVPIYSRVLIPFRKNVITRLAARFFAPGWISGIGFFFLCAALWAVALHGDDFFFIGKFTAKFGPRASNFHPGQVFLFLSMINLLLFPLLLIHLFFRKRVSGNFTLALYVFVQCVLLFLTTMIVPLATTVVRSEAVIYTLVPLPSVLIVAHQSGHVDEPRYLVVALATTFFSVVVPLLRQRQACARFRLHLKHP